MENLMEKKINHQEDYLNPYTFQPRLAYLRFFKLYNDFLVILIGS